MNTLECDVLVVGAGAGGLTAAVTAAHAGLNVIVAEKAPYFGGTTALSGGAIWVPCSPNAQADGIEDSLVEAERYVQGQTGNHFQPEHVRAYFQAGPDMLRFLDDNTSVKFVSNRSSADYLPDAPGASKGGRSLSSVPFDGRQLGTRLKDLRPPLAQQTLFGMSIGSGAHYRHFLHATRSLRSAAIAADTVVKYGLDLLRYGRGVRLHNGSALMARLGKSALDKGVTILLSTPATQLLDRDGAVTGALVETDGEVTRIEARRGVILASGGFPRDPERRGRFYPAQQTVSIAPDENAGDGARMAERLGGLVEEQGGAAAYSAVLSKLVTRSGRTLVYAHFVDRAKPGIIAVDSTGRRFCNESNSYHHVAQDMIRLGIDGVNKRAFFIADHRALRRYGLGAARPFPIPLAPYLRCGYLTRANDVGGLARKLGMPAETLVYEMERFNRGAALGQDPEFKRGANAYNAYQGDFDHAPNPCLEPLSSPPYYAVEVFPGDLGTFTGLKVAPDAQVLDAQGRRIPNLFAVGNDAASAFSGACLGGGITIGPAMVFGYIAGKAISAPVARARSGHAD